MNNNGVTNSNQNQEPILIPMNGTENVVAATQQPAIQQIQVVQPETVVQQQTSVATQQPVQAPVQSTVVQQQATTVVTQPVQTTPIQQVVEQPTEPKIELPSTTKEGIPLNHPQIIINGADQTVLDQEKAIENQRILNEEATKFETSTEPKKIEEPKEKTIKEKKPIKVNKILALIIIILIIVIFYSYKTHTEQINNLAYNCTAVASSKEEKELDINSTLVQTLYNKVKTNIREDIAQKEFDNTMKLYLAYRQIPEHEKYDTNCNLFDTQKMEPYKCEVSTSFVPKGFKEETLLLELKKLFGESTDIPLDNIKLKNACIGGYEYIKERKEFVQGRCETNVTTPFKVTKELKSAVSTKNMIKIFEDVKYRESEKQELPNYLKSGTYIYTFRLDINYNWVLISKKYDEKY